MLLHGCRVQRTMEDQDMKDKLRELGVLVAEFKKARSGRGGCYPKRLKEMALRACKDHSIEQISESTGISCDALGRWQQASSIASKKVLDPAVEFHDMGLLSASYAPPIMNETDRVDILAPNGTRLSFFASSEFKLALASLLLQGAGR